jgi:hypothetical protein
MSWPVLILLLPAAGYIVRRWRVRVYVQRGDEIRQAGMSVKPFLVPRPRPFLVDPLGDSKWPERGNPREDMPKRDFLRPWRR